VRKTPSPREPRLNIIWK